VAADVKKPRNVRCVALKADGEAIEPPSGRLRGAWTWMVTQVGALFLIQDPRVCNTAVPPRWSGSWASGSLPRTRCCGSRPGSW
jgi:hypothetical protein